MRLYCLCDACALIAEVCFLRNNDRQYLRVRLPPDAEVWTTTVGAKPVKPARDESNQLILPTPKSENAFVVEVGAWSYFASL